MTQNLPIVYTDLDGSLLNSKKTIDKKNLDAVKLLRMNGGLFSIATGRTIDAVRAYLDIVKPDIPCILYNGSVIYDAVKKEALYLKYLDTKKAKKISSDVVEKFPETSLEIVRFGETVVYNDNKESREHLEICNEDAVRMDFDKIDGRILKILFAAPMEIIEKIAKYLDVQNDMDGMYYVRSEKVYLEILPKGVSKGSALEELKENILPKLGFKKTKIYSLGDYDNDIEMLQAADFGAVPQNATDNAKAASNIVLDASCDESAAAELICKYILK